MLKAVVAATAAVTIAGTSLVYAQPRDGRQDAGRGGPPTIEDVRAFQAARLAALRAGLTLTTEQERHWPAFEAAMRELQQQRLDRITKMREARRQGQTPSTDPAERMRQRAARLSESGAVLKRLADATDPLYRSLDDAQKRRFAILTRAGGPRGAWQRRGGRDGGEPRMMPRPHRTDAAPALPQGERTFNRKIMDVTTDVTSLGEVSAIAGRKFVIIEDAAVLGRKPVVLVAPAQFGGKASFGARSELLSQEGVAFRRKITIEEPAGFGRKPVREI